VRYLGEFENTAPATRKLVSRLTEKYDHLHFCYAQRGKPPRSGQSLERLRVRIPFAQKV
jgi:hypothetical protein